MTIYQRIKLRRIELGLSQEELAKKTGYAGRSVISKLENGERNISQDKLCLFAEALDVSANYLLYGSEEFSLPAFDNIFPIQLKKYPLLGSIACGEPNFMDEDRESYISAGTEIQADFCLQCKGDSMINARIMDGDIVFIRRQNFVENGEIAAVAIDDEATLKRVTYFPEKNMLILKAENPKYSDFIFQGEELDHVNILGKAVAFQSDVR